MWRFQLFRVVVRPSFLRALWSELDHERLARYGDLALRVMDLRPAHDRNPDFLVSQVAAALELISAAGQGFGELVTSHLKTVAVAPGIHVLSVNPPIYWGGGAFLESPEKEYVAGQLVWVATAIRLYRDARFAKRRADHARIKAACWAAEERFLATLPDSNWWIDRLRPKDSAA